MRIFLKDSTCTESPHLKVRRRRTRKEKRGENCSCLTINVKKLYDSIGGVEKNCEMPELHKTRKKQKKKSFRVGVGERKENGRPPVRNGWFYESPLCTIANKQ